MSAAMSAPKVRFESTPNPQTFRFSLIGSDMVFTETPIAYNSAAEAQFAPLAKKLFGFPWASGVYVGREFITVTKQDWVDWEILAAPLAGLLGEHIESGQPVMLELQASLDEDKNDSPVVKQIKRILQNEIKPVVALDGGDIVFAKYENNILQIHMRGSCAGCPSSQATLKDGIEVRLKELIPEIKEVVAV